MATVNVEHPTLIAALDHGRSLYDTGLPVAREDKETFAREMAGKSHRRSIYLLEIYAKAENGDDTFRRWYCVPLSGDIWRRFPRLDVVAPPFWKD